jgi:hypothetical protein
MLLQAVREEIVKVGFGKAPKRTSAELFQNPNKEYSATYITYNFDRYLIQITYIPFRLTSIF